MVEPGIEPGSSDHQATRLIVVKKGKTQILCSTIIFPPEKSAVHEKKKKNMLGPNGPQMIWHTRFAFRITKATVTHWEYVILIDFPRQQCLCERAPVLRYSTLPLVLYILH
jgi:hypothetical protein